MNAAIPADIPALFANAWNAHDMDDFATLFHPDASFVNRFGAYWRGIDPIVAAHRAIHETVYSDSRLETDAPDVDWLSDDIAILHFWTRLTSGAAHPAGPHTVDTMIMAVATRRDEAWRIQSLENVTLIDPRTGVPVLRER